MDSVTGLVRLSCLHVLVFDILAARDAIGDVEMDEFRWQIHASGKSIHHLVGGGGGLLGNAWIANGPG